MGYGVTLMKAKAEARPRFDAGALVRRTWVPSAIGARWTSNDLAVTAHLVVNGPSEVRVQWIYFEETPTRLGVKSRSLATFALGSEAVAAVNQLRKPVDEFVRRDGRRYFAVKGDPDHLYPAIDRKPAPPAIEAAAKAFKAAEGDYQATAETLASVFRSHATT